VGASGGCPRCAIAAACAVRDDRWVMGSVAWKVLRGSAVVLATLAAEKALQSGWQAVTGRPPPAAPDEPGTPWQKPLAWALVSGAVIGATRLFATRAAAAVYEKSAGTLPKAIRKEVDSAPPAVAPSATV
jgi:hypothetical protein